VIVCEVYNDRLFVYSLTGDIIRHIPCTQLSYTSCICEAGDDSVIITDCWTSKVYKLDLTTEEIEWTSTHVEAPTAVVRYAKRYVLVADYSGTSISVLDINTGHFVKGLDLDLDLDVRNPWIKDIQLEGDQLVVSSGISKIAYCRLK